MTDLVIPVRDFGDVHAPPPQIGPPMGGLTSETSAATPYLTGNTPLMGGQGVGTPSGAAGSSATLRNKEMQSTIADSETQQDKLINLIISTINPTSWQEMGGSGTINYFPLGKSLVINQTSDIQGEIADLLAALRKLQEQEVSVEVRFITVSENFYESIGVNFNMNVTTDANSKYGAQILSGVFQQGGVLNNFQPKNLLTGLTPAGTLTIGPEHPDLATTPSSARTPSSAAIRVPGAGGLSLGLAFLSDIQVYLFMQAAQGDVRTNVMQAPKLTLYNGQTATLQALDSQFFVSQVAIQIAPERQSDLRADPAAVPDGGYQSDAASGHLGGSSLRAAVAEPDLDQHRPRRHDAVPDRGPGLRQPVSPLSSTADGHAHAVLATADDEQLVGRHDGTRCRTAARCSWAVSSGCRSPATSMARRS